MPASPWEFDEILFYQGLHHYDPLAHHPPPPGYPVFIHVGQLVRLATPSDLAALVSLSFVASLVGFALLALAFGNLTGDKAAGLVGAMFFYWSPAMLINSTLPMSDAGALALLAASLYFASVSRPALFALFAALTIGWRPQCAIFMVPFFLCTVVFLQGARKRLIALGVFTIVCLLWLVPLAMAVGGVKELIAFERGQGQYLASHDAAESRTGWTPARIAFRFVGRAWGTELMALPILGLATLGFVLVIRKRAVWPFALGAAVYIAVALRVMDPADGVRYSLPFLVFSAFLAGVGAASLLQRFPYALPVAAAIVFVIYTSPLLRQRRLTDSPPVRAAAFALASTPANAIALYELPLWPHAQYLLGDRDPHRVDDGLAKFWDRPDVPLFLYTDGASARPDAKVFAWAPSDVYVKLTRNHYRTVSVIPLPPERRFRIVEGVYAPERDPEGREWRWVGPVAKLQLPHGPARKLTLQLGLPQASPVETNRVTVGTTVATITRGKTTTVTLDVPSGAPLIELRGERSFVPAEVRELRSGDRRRLAFELYDLRTH